MSWKLMMNVLRIAPFRRKPKPVFCVILITAVSIAVTTIGPCRLNMAWSRA